MNGGRGGREGGEQLQRRESEDEGRRKEEDEIQEIHKSFSHTSPFVSVVYLNSLLLIRSCLSYTGFRAVIFY